MLLKKKHFATSSARWICMLALISCVMLLSVNTVHAKHAPKKIKTTTVACPSPQSLQPLLNLGSIYFGEWHGTVESPHLVGCVVDAEVAAKTAPLFVAVELPAKARDTNDEYWTHLDGRSSGAMNNLVTHLEALEQQGKLTLDFLVPDQMSSENALNRQLGEHLRDLAAKGRLIAITGNFHSQRKQMLSSSAIVPAGAFVGDRIKTVSILAAHGGTGWNCSPECAVQKEKGITGTKAGALIDGKSVGHDYIYVVDTFTASPPAHAR